MFASISFAASSATLDTVTRDERRDVTFRDRPSPFDRHPPNAGVRHNATNWKRSVNPFTRMVSTLGHSAGDIRVIKEDHSGRTVGNRIRRVRMTVTDLDLHRGFAGVGTAGMPAETMAAFLDGTERLPAVQAIRAAMRSSLLDREAPQTDIALLDAACGTGTETRLLAESLRGRRVIGLDHNQGLLDLAAARAAGTANDDHSNGAQAADGRTAVENSTIEWICADVRVTGLPDESVAAVRIERGLIYVSDGDFAVAEFARVLAPGGILVAYELDYGGLLLPIGGASPALLREVIAVMEASLPAPWAGRRLARWMTDAGLTDVTVTPMSIFAGPAVADRIVGDTVRTAVSEGRLHPDALDWLDSLVLEPPSLTAVTAAGFITTAVKAKR
jgi:ubiquinone/menaquinone biosynthesis C-methylase UbiE